MNTYIAFIRGINVSGQKLIRMAELKHHLESIGFSGVKTYIQSGNLVFGSEENSPEKVRTSIEEKILSEYGFEADVLIRLPDEITKIIAGNPFADRDLERLYVTLLAEEPAEAHIEKLKTFDHSPEEFFLIGKTIYFYAPNGYGRAKMNNNFFESKLKVKATTRNWKTINVLAEMAM